MYQEYALDPDGLIDSAVPKILFDLFGKDSGRMLASIQEPREWALYIQAEIRRRKDHGTIRPQQFLRIQALLDPLLKSPAVRGDKFFPHHYKRPAYNASTSWGNNVLIGHRAAPYAAIVTNEQIGTVAPDEVDLEDPAFALTPSARIPRNAKALVHLLDPLLSVSSQLVLVDPHFKPREERFRALLPEIFYRHKHLKTAQIYLKHDSYKPCRPQDFDDWMIQDGDGGRLLLPGEQLHVTTLKERRNGEKLHARYLITEVGGVAVDPGLDVDVRENSGNTFLVTRISAEIHRTLWGEYVLMKDFQVVTQFSING